MRRAIRNALALVGVLPAMIVLVACGRKAPSRSPAASRPLQSTTTTTGAGLRPGQIMPGITISNPYDTPSTEEALSSQLTALLRNYDSSNGSTTATCSQSTNPAFSYRYTCIVHSGEGATLDALVFDVTSSGQVSFVTDVLADMENGGAATTATSSNPEPPVPSATTSSTTTPATASQDCGSFGSGSGTVRVSVTGSVSCSTALRVMRDSMAGKGKALGEGLASGTETDGWKCSYGMGVRTCQLGAASITGKF